MLTCECMQIECMQIENVIHFPAHASKNAHESKALHVAAKGIRHGPIVCKHGLRQDLLYELLLACLHLRAPAVYFANDVTRMIQRSRLPGEAVAADKAHQANVGAHQEDKHLSNPEKSQPT